MYGGRVADGWSADTETLAACWLFAKGKVRKNRQARNELDAMGVIVPDTRQRSCGNRRAPTRKRNPRKEARIAPGARSPKVQFSLAQVAAGQAVLRILDRADDQAIGPPASGPVWAEPRWATQNTTSLAGEFATGHSPRKSIGRIACADALT